MIEPLILGRGAAGRTLRQALAMYPDDVGQARWLDRDAPLPAPRDPDQALLVIAGPHALHAPRLLEAAARGYRYAICEKPAAVDLAQVAQLDGLPVATWICHGYRLLWGPQELKRAFDEGRFGEVIAIEGRYWQSSAADGTVKPHGWKDDPTLSGPSDVLLDLGTHWADLVVHLFGRLPDTASVRRWYVNARASHRDTHVHVVMDFGSARTFGSVSKTVHGAGNLLELHVLGERAAARWSFSAPDVVVWGEGRTQRTTVRAAADWPARPAPFHGLGWTEGYARLVAEVVAEMTGRRPAHAPTLAEHLAVVRLLLEAAGRE
jgi:predicted dehydrogenase